MSAIHTPADLAEMLSITEPKVLEYRRTYGWPSFKIGKTIRFTAEHVELILAAHDATPKADTSAPPVIEGQTRRSASRRRSA